MVYVRYDSSNAVAGISRRSCPSLGRHQGRGAEIARRVTHWLISTQAAEYKKCGLKMEVVMIPDKCGREKTVGLRFLSSTGYNAPTV